MSRQRQRDRAAREAEAARVQAEQAARAPRASGSRKRPAEPAPARPRTGKPAPGKQTVYRQRRFPPLPWRLKAALAAGWLVVAALVLYLVPSWQGRLGLMVVATFALPLIVVIVRDPTRRTPR